MTDYRNFFIDIQGLDPREALAQLNGIYNNHIGGDLYITERGGWLLACGEGIGAIVDNIEETIRVVCDANSPMANALGEGGAICPPHVTTDGEFWCSIVADSTKAERIRGDLQAKMESLGYWRGERHSRVYDWCDVYGRVIPKHEANRNYRYDITIYDGGEDPIYSEVVIRYNIESGILDVLLCPHVIGGMEGYLPDGALDYLISAGFTGADYVKKLQAAMWQYFHKQPPKWWLGDKDAKNPLRRYRIITAMTTGYNLHFAMSAGYYGEHSVMLTIPAHRLAVETVDENGELGLSITLPDVKNPQAMFAWLMSKFK